MARTLQIRWPTLGASVEVAMLPAQAPRLCELLIRELPFQSVQEHALITGCMLFASTRITTTLRENVQTFTEMGVGACYFAGASQNVGIVYGPVTEPEGHSVWGRVRADHLAVLAEVGRRVWANTIAPYGDLALNPAAKRVIPVAFS